MNQHEVLAAFDSQVRRSLTPPVPGWVVDDLGHLVRATGPEGSHTGGFVEWSGLGGLSPAEVDAVVEEQVAYFRSTGRASEWKHYAHDQPADLSERLVAAGLRRDDPEALVVGGTDEVLAACRAAGPATGVRVRRLVDLDELDAVAALHGLVWGDDWDWLADELRAEISAKPDDTVVYLAEDEATGALMCSAWIRFAASPDVEFAGLWGGSTHPDWRRRGAYRALVQVRAELAAERGTPYLQVDASPDSEPILARLGLVRLSTTTPHTWKPPG